MPPSPNMGGMHMTTTTCSWRPYRVALRTQECRGVISLYLEPTDGALPPAFAAGQYVELRMPGIEPHAFFLVGPSGDRLVRLTIEVGDEPFIGEVGRIAKLRIGDPVELSEPKGELAMEPGETPVVIMTEDIGCLVAHAFLAEMAEVEPMRNVRVLCQFPNGTRMLMREELRKLVDLMPNAGLAVFLAAPFSTDTAGPSPKPSGPTSSSSASFTPEFTRRSSERLYPGQGSSFANLPRPCKIRPCR